MYVMSGIQNLLLFLKWLLRPWDVSRRAERQKLMVNSREEMSARVQKVGFAAKLLLPYDLNPNDLFETW